MLQVFHLDVVYICNGFQVFSMCFASVLDVCYKYFSYFRRILQVFHLGVAHVAMGPTWYNHLLQLLGDVRAARGGYLGA
jgi:hypothetical protein